MKRYLIPIEALSDWHNLQLALYKAAKGKRHRADVIVFFQNADVNLKVIQEQVMRGDLPRGGYRCFSISDPKPRKIVAVSFEMRIIHHAIMKSAGQFFQRSLILHSYAC